MPSDVLALHQLPLSPPIEVLCCHYAQLKTWDYADLAAPYWRWYWVDQSGASIKLDGKVFELDSNQVVLIPPNTHFSANNRNIIGFLYIHFLVEATYKQSSPDIQIIPLAAEQIQFIRNFANQFAKLEQEAVSPLLSLPLALVGLALSQTARDRWTNSYSDARATSAIKVIESNYPRAVPNQKLSRLVGMNPNAFIRMFKQVTGQTPRQYLQSLRLKEASSLLHHSQLSIEAIAEKTGFNDRQHLSLMFRKSFQITPAQFRKNFLKL
jgi:AraC-like DNA-binding protein